MGENTNLNGLAGCLPSTVPIFEWLDMRPWTHRTLKPDSPSIFCCEDQIFDLEKWSEKNTVFIHLKFKAVFFSKKRFQKNPDVKLVWRRWFFKKFSHLGQDRSDRTRELLRERDARFPRDARETRDVRETGRDGRGERERDRNLAQNFQVVVECLR